jgi:hypothetical protein
LVISFNKYICSAKKRAFKMRQSGLHAEADDLDLATGVAKSCSLWSETGVAKTDLPELQTAWTEFSRIEIGDLRPNVPFNSKVIYTQRHLAKMKECGATDEYFKASLADPMFSENKPWSPEHASFGALLHELEMFGTLCMLDAHGNLNMFYGSFLFVCIVLDNSSYSKVMSMPSAECQILRGGAGIRMDLTLSEPEARVRERASQP